MEVSKRLGRLQWSCEDMEEGFRGFKGRRNWLEVVEPGCFRWWPWRPSELYSEAHQGTVARGLCKPASKTKLMRSTSLSPSLTRRWPATSCTHRRGARLAPGAAQRVAQHATGAPLGAAYSF
jgi:hypothetical protein